VKVAGYDDQAAQQIFKGAMVQGHFAVKCAKKMGLYLREKALSCSSLKPFTDTTEGWARSPYAPSDLRAEMQRIDLIVETNERLKQAMDEFENELIPEETYSLVLLEAKQPVVGQARPVLPGTEDAMLTAVGLDVDLDPDQDLGDDISIPRSKTFEMSATKRTFNPTQHQPSDPKLPGHKQ
jgi:hypothetical protein